MIVFPNAKINIGLNVTGKRSDGFHNLETIFFPIPLCDILEIQVSQKMNNFNFSGLEIDQSNYKQNLVFRAYEKLAEVQSFGNINLHLHKIIPSGAGLGGGSSDASFTIKALNELFNLKLSNSYLESLVSNLGSDCPFFIDNKPAFATGRGEILEEIKIDLSGYQLTVVHPNIHISTPWAFGQITPRKPQMSLSELIKQPINIWKDSIINDFEQPVFDKYPQIGDIKNTFYNHGALFSLLSGSGSAVFGISKKEIDFRPFFSDYFVWSAILQ